MNTLIVTVPDSIHNQLQKLADREGISIDQLTTAALTEKIAALLSPDFLVQRAERGTRRKFEKAMAKVVDTNPVRQDSL